MFDSGCWGTERLQAVVNPADTLPGSIGDNRRECYDRRSSVRVQYLKSLTLQPIFWDFRRGSSTQICGLRLQNPASVVEVGGHFCRKVLSVRVNIACQIVNT